MSHENVNRFYILLETDSDLREKALSLRKIYKNPEDVLDAFLRLAAEYKCPFSDTEYFEVMYEKAMNGKSPGGNA